MPELPIAVKRAERPSLRPPVAYEGDCGPGATILRGVKEEDFRGWPAGLGDPLEKAVG